MTAKWMVYAKKADFNKIAQDFHISPVTARVIRNREVCGDEAVGRYLYGTWENFYSPHLLKDGDLAADILLRKIKQGRRIRIVGDYDIDGVCSTYLLFQALNRLGAWVDYEIPDRVKDGYGINEQIVQQAFEDKVDTILTCDNGISAVEQTAYAKKNGLTILITDHHELPECLPKADAIVNPKQKDCTYPYSELCGAGVAYKLVQALYEIYQISGVEEYLQFTAIATVCDVMKLTGENRIIVSYGLKQLQKTKHAGLCALMKVNSIHPERLSAYHLGFILGPCLNATGRLDSALKGVELLSCEDETMAGELASQLKHLNDIRKEMTTQGVEQAIVLAESKERKQDKVLLLYLPKCHESLAGIIAGRLREKYNHPTIVLTHAKDYIKGSGRSIERYSMFEELVKCKQYLLKFGGHPMAAGLSLREEKIEPFRNALNENCTLTEEDFVVKVSIDIVLALSGITKEMIQELSILEPFGRGNEKPIFADKGLKIRRLSLVGRTTQYAKLVIEDRFGCQMNAIYFGDSEQFLKELESFYGEEEVRKMFQGRGEKASLSVIYYPSINEYQNRESLQIIIEHYQIEA